MEYKFIILKNAIINVARKGVYDAKNSSKACKLGKVYEGSSLQQRVGASGLALQSLILELLWVFL